MKQLHLIANLKMNLTKEMLIPYFEKLGKISNQTNNVVGVCVPFIYLQLAKEKLQNSKVLVGAQNMHHEDFGAFTGEVSAKMLTDFGTNLVIIGHSERRNLFFESDEIVNKKLKKALDCNLTAILCVGETLQERQEKKTINVLEKQLNLAINDIEPNKLKNIYIAYEPVWAIGTGVSATKQDAEQACLFIKNYFINKFKFAPKVLYGGSLNENNAFELLSNPSVNGGLIGGASLNINGFEKIINTNIN